MVPRHSSLKIISWTVFLSARLDRKVESGKPDQNKADELLAEFTEKINQWDGTGFPEIDKKRIRSS
jgi:ATP-dependent 26S proteasome regulatory subunit